MTALALLAAGGAPIGSGVALAVLRRTRRRAMWLCAVLASGLALLAVSALLLRSWVLLGADLAGLAATGALFRAARRTWRRVERREADGG